MFPFRSLDSRLSTLDTHWGVQDSNLRRHKPSDLQSDPFDRFGNSPRHAPLILSRRVTDRPCFHGGGRASRAPAPTNFATATITNAWTEPAATGFPAATQPPTAARCTRPK